MAIAKKVTKNNHLPGEDDDRFVVYSKQFNDLVDVVLEIEGADGTLTADTISEETAAAGVTVDSVLLKDGAVVAPGSVAGTAAITITAGDLVLSDGGISVAAQAVTPNTDSGAASTIDDNAVAVDVGAVTTDANDWIVLPAIADVPVGHQIKIACNAGTNFELRTPATSGELINTVDSDGTQEYLCVDTEVVVITKVSDTDGWVAYDIPALGGVGTATIPD